MHIVFWASIVREPIVSMVSALPGVTLEVVESRDALLAALPDAEVVIMPGSTTAYHAAMAAGMAAAPKLRWVQLFTAGYDGFSLHGLAPGIALTLPGGNSRHVVAEHAMALLLSLGRGIPAHLANQARARWDRGPADRMSSLEGRTLAVVGFGHIGREIARRARAFDMHVIGVMRTPRTEPLAHSVRPLAELGDVLAEADAVILSLPLSPETHHLIDAARLARCKPGLLLVNIARGGLIDGPALAAALQEGRIAGAGLDVTDPEPLPPDDPLWQAPNLIITPHVAAAGSPRSRTLLGEAIVANILRWQTGEELADRVSLTE